MPAVPQISDPSDEDLAHLAKQREWVLGHYDDPSRAESIEGKLILLDGILKNKWIEPSETWKLQSLGVVFGHALAQKLGLRWQIVEDEYGRDPALILDNTTLRIFPLTMISKRIEQGEEVDVVDLFGTASGHIAALARELK
jgi:hypothetical protein